MNYNFSVPGEDTTQPTKGGAIFPKFYIKAMPDGQASKREGRPIFRDVEWVDLYIAGDKTCVPSTAVTDEHRRRWPDHYRAFKEGQEAPNVGTPIAQWPAISVSQAEELKALRVYTVEQLADMSDTGLQSIGMGGRALQAKARAFIDAAKGSAGVQQHAEENERLKKRLEQQDKLIQDLAAEVKAMREGKPKRGPMKKAVAEVIGSVQ